MLEIDNIINCQKGTKYSFVCKDIKFLRKMKLKCKENSTFVCIIVKQALSNG